MPEDTESQTAIVGANGASVNVTLGHGFREAGIIIAVLILALVGCGVLSIIAYEKAKSAEYEAARWAFWGQTVESRLIAAGIAIPPSPALEKADK